MTFSNSETYSTEKCIHGVYRGFSNRLGSKSSSCSICMSTEFVDRTPIKKSTVKRLVEPEVTENEIEPEADHEAEPLEETIEELSEN